MNTRYSLQTGMILGYVVNSPALPGEGVIEGQWDAGEFWIVDGEPVQLSTMALTITGRTISGVPEGAKIQFQNETFAIPTTWTAPGSGSDYVTVTCVGYRPESVWLKGYDVARAEAYPSVGDQLGAIGKALKAMADAGVTLPAETLAVLDQIDAVKASIPKP